jgi:polyferredoxin
MLLTSILVRHSLCKYICAAGLMQMLFGWASPVSLRVRMDSARAEECTNCRKCEKACFMNVLPRANRRDISCVNCGDCLVACNRELGNGKGLFRYQSGEKITASGPEKNAGHASSGPCSEPASPMRT